MSEEKLNHDEVIAIKQLLKKLGETDIPPQLQKHLDETEKEEVCEQCKFPIHPNLPCSEVISFYNHVDEEYLRLVRLIFEEGKVKKNRTGVDTIGVFGAQAKFEVDLDAFPILTTKKVFFKAIVHELLWFLRGDTNIKYLVDNGVHIWDEWAYKRYFDCNKINGRFEGDKWMRYFKGSTRVKTLEEADTLSMYPQDEFIQKIKEDKEFAERWGELGEGTYGGMWRDFPHFKQTYKSHNPAGVGDEYERDGVDQLQKVIDKLKTNPDDRRMIVSAWHPYWVDHCALPPCHCLFHFNTEELTLDERVKLYKGEPRAFYDGYVLDELKISKRKLNLLLYQRSCDSGLGVPFNITSYALLLAMVAHCVGMVPGTFTHTYGDLHIYENHKDQLKLQMTRSHKKLPSLWINPNVKDLFKFTFEDIKLIGYDPHPAIKMDVAV